MGEVIRLAPPPSRHGQRMTMTVKFALEAAMKRARKAHALCEAGVKRA
ncbi:hypothetical protein [Ottowia testudinis]|uniref:Uncharacterized protein n=1 Tax=Ottowia testudinis TaxID=2816950 RepID=A0A975CI25_9BURK|nr:hypothetical protein [Ottowia testudinis]QTD45476.1 hypothetical protein J1M35_00675 [Ottowia testudinis]